MADTRNYRELGTYATAGTLLVRDKLIAPGGSSGITITPPFVYDAVGTENPVGFSIPFPSGARGGQAYVAQVQYEDGAVDFMVVTAPPSGYADDHIVVKTSGQLALHDKISVIIADR